MKAATYKVNSLENAWEESDPNFDKKGAQLVLAFGEKAMLKNKTYFENLKSNFPNADLVLCSTSGEIFQDEVNDNSLSVVAMHFNQTKIKPIKFEVSKFHTCQELGENIYKELKSNDLQYIMLFSDGSVVNASELIKGIHSDNTIKVTGGLAGDGVHFQDTLVDLNAAPRGANVVAIGFYGNKLNVTQGSAGGWEEFGLSRTITKSKNNVLYEVDGQNILDLYKRYLGDYSKELPGAALFFPLSMEFSENDEKVVRTILGIDEKEKSLIFAGDMPEGATVRFMKSNNDNLIDAAKDATLLAVDNQRERKPELALVVSCVGRKLVLRNRIDEEIREIQEVIGDDVPLGGFYSYGEISTKGENQKAILHNQTLTITLFDELT